MKGYISREVTPILDPGDFQQVIEKPRWKNLSPNFPSASALLPQYFTEERIARLMEALSNGSPLTKLNPWDLNAKPELEVKDLGKLSFVSKGESKWCYLLTSEDQKKMAIHIGGANAQFSIPSDPYVHMVAKQMGKYGLSYSDLRTYLCLPVNMKTDEYDIKYDGPISMMFQEWGGEITLENPKDPKIKSASERVINYMLRRGYVTNRSEVRTLTLQELSHPRHYLLNQGISNEPAIIDIPFESNFYSY